TSGEGDASRVLSSASLVVQQLAGITTEPVLVEPNGGLIAATQAAGLLVIGLSDRWRSEGLGPVRAAIAKAAPAPILFVRRGARAHGRAQGSEARPGRRPALPAPFPPGGAGGRGGARAAPRPDHRGVGGGRSPLPRGRLRHGRLADREDRGLRDVRRRRRRAR